MSSNCAVGTPACRDERGAGRGHAERADRESLEFSIAIANPIAIAIAIGCWVDPILEHGRPGYSLCPLINRRA